MSFDTLAALNLPAAATVPLQQASECAASGDYGNALLHLAKVSGLVALAGGDPSVATAVDRAHAQVLARLGRFADAAAKVYQQVYGGQGSEDGACLLAQLLTCSPLGVQKHLMLPRAAADAGAVWRPVLLKQAQFEELTPEDVSLVDLLLVEPRAAVKRAVWEHNIHALVQQQQQVALPALWEYLAPIHTAFGGGVDDLEREAYDTIVAMVLHHRLRARIDQQQGVVYFPDPVAVGSNSDYAATEAWLSRLDRLAARIEAGK